jgi:hypothetical protein
VTKSKIPRNEKMCKDKWNGLNMTIKKFQIIIGHPTPCWDLIMEEHEKHHLPI